MTIDRALIPMSQRELHRYHTLRLVLERRITGAQAAVSLGLSLRHVRRLTSRLRQAGRRALVHGNRGRVKRDVKRDGVHLFHCSLAASPLQNKNGPRGVGVPKGPYLQQSK